MPGSLGDRVLASMRGRVSIEELRPALAASGSAYDDLFAAEALRHELATAGITPWTASPAETSQLLCAWNAYALRSLADAYITAETGSAMTQTGYLARVTADQVSRLLADAPAWSGLARRAAADPGFDVATEAPLPARLPAWVIVEPCPRSHLEAMQAGTAALLERVEAAFADLDPLASQSPNAGSVARLRGLLAELQGRIQAGPTHGGGTVRASMHEAAEAGLRDGAARCFALGQLMARPRLLDRPSAPASYSVPPWRDGSRDAYRYGYDYDHDDHHGHHDHDHHGHHGHHGDD